MVGDRLIFGEGSVTKYYIRISEEINLEGDPMFSCTEYKKAGDYNTCLEEEYVRQTLDLLNCTPPWMTEEQRRSFLHYLDRVQKSGNILFNL